jgi:hypothetical protein
MAHLYSTHIRHWRTDQGQAQTAWAKADLRLGVRAVLQGRDNTWYQGDMIIVEGKSAFKQLMGIHRVDPPLRLMALTSVLRLIEKGHCLSFDLFQV